MAKLLAVSQGCDRSVIVGRESSQKTAVLQEGFPRYVLNSIGRYERKVPDDTVQD